MNFDPIVLSPVFGFFLPIIMGGLNKWLDAPWARWWASWLVAVAFAAALYVYAGVTGQVAFGLLDAAKAAPIIWATAQAVLNTHRTATK